MFAVTERLLLRPGWGDDVPALIAAVNNEKIARNLAQLPWPYGESDARWFIDHFHGKGAPEFFAFTRTGGAPQLVGAVGLHEDPEEPEGNLEIGYWIAEKYWGQGYATEAARAVVDLARLSLRMKALRSAYFEDNPASGRVLTKLGFKPTGKVVNRQSRGRGEAVRCVLMELSFAPLAEKRATPAMRSSQMQMMLAA